MFKFIALSIGISVLSVSVAAKAEPQRYAEPFLSEIWLCEGKELSPANTGPVTLRADMDTPRFVLQTGDESLEVISPERLSRWRYPREKCDINIQRHSDQYMNSLELTYRCPKVRGYFYLDIRNSQAFYKEELLEMSYERHLYEFNSCRLN